MTDKELLLKVKEALEFYADDKNHEIDSSIHATEFPTAKIEYDKGDLAKEALAELNEVIDKEDL